MRLRALAGDAAASDAQRAVILAYKSRNQGQAQPDAGDMPGVCAIDAKEDIFKVGEYAVEYVVRQSSIDDFDRNRHAHQDSCLLHN
jgi:hypothetical protein